MRSVAIRLALLAALAPAAHAADIDPATLLPRPDTFTGAVIDKATVALTAPDRWASLVTRDRADSRAGVMTHRAVWRRGAI